MAIRLELDRIAPGVEIGPHRHGVETVVFVASGELVFQHGEALERRTLVRAGDLLYEAPAELHLVRNEGPTDVLALLAAADPAPERAGMLLRRWDSVDAPVRRGSEARELERDGVRRRFLAEPGEFGSVTFTVTEVELAPGAKVGWHRHPEAEHALVVLEGRGSIHVGEIEETLEPLKGIRVLPGRPHRLENTGRTPLRYYACASPGTDPTLDHEAMDARGRRDVRGRGFEA